MPELDCEREVNHKGRASPHSALYCDPASVSVYDSLGDGKPEAEAPMMGLLRPIKSLEDMRQMFRRDAFSII